MCVCQCAFEKSGFIYRFSGYSDQIEVETIMMILHKVILLLLTYSYFKVKMPLPNPQIISYINLHNTWIQLIAFQVLHSEHGNHLLQLQALHKENKYL